MNQLREALAAAAEHFEEYAREHRAKAGRSATRADQEEAPIRFAKADTNEAMAKVCRDALAAAATPDYVLGFHDARQQAERITHSLADDHISYSGNHHDTWAAALNAAAVNIKTMKMSVATSRIMSELSEQSHAWSIAKDIDSLAVNVPVAWNARILARAFLRLHGNRPDAPMAKTPAVHSLNLIATEDTADAPKGTIINWPLPPGFTVHWQPATYDLGKTIKPFDPLTARGTTGLRPGQVIEKLSEDGRPADSGLMPVWTKTNDGWRVSATETIPPSVPSNSGGSSPSSNPPDYRHVRLKDGHGIDVPVPMNPWHGIPFVLELPKGMLDDISTPPPINALKHMIAAPGTNGHTIMSLFLDVLVKDGVVTASETMDTYLYGRPGGAVAIVQRPIKDRHLHVRWPWSDAGPMNDAENKRVAGVLKAIDAPAFKECEGCKYPFACAEARSCQTEWFRLASDRHNRRPR